MNNLWACSDLHLGSGSPRDDWTAEDRERFIASIPTGGQLVLVGDILDYLRFGRGVFDGVNAQILSLLADQHTIYVRGNHCPPAPLLAEHYPRELICDMLILGRVLFMHGNAGDIVNGRFHAVGDAVCKIGNALGKLSPKFEDWATAAAGKLTAKGRWGDAALVREYAVETAMGMMRGDVEDSSAPFEIDRRFRLEGIKAVVCGHSHVRERGVAVMGDRKVEYVNCGCWKHGEPVWTEIDFCRP